MYYQTQMLSTFVTLFLDIGQCFHTTTKKTVLDKQIITYPTFSMYFRPLHMLVQKRYTDDKQNSKIADGHHPYFCLILEPLYIVHLGIGSFFRKLQKYGNIGFMSNCF